MLLESLYAPLQHIDRFSVRSALPAGIRSFWRQQAPLQQSNQYALVVNGHPDPRPERYCSALADQSAEGCRAAGWQTDTLSLGAFDFSDVATVVDTDPRLLLYARATLVVLVFPLWLGEAPVAVSRFVACAEKLKRETFPVGFSHLKAIVTMDLPALTYRSPKKPFRFSQLSPDETVFIGSVNQVCSATRADWLRLARKSIKPPIRR